MPNIKYNLFNCESVPSGLIHIFENVLKTLEQIFLIQESKNKIKFHEAVIQLDAEAWLAFKQTNEFPDIEDKFTDIIVMNDITKTEAPYPEAIKIEGNFIKSSETWGGISSAHIYLWHCLNLINMSKTLPNDINFSSIHIALTEKYYKEAIELAKSLIEEQQKTIKRNKINKKNLDERHNNTTRPFANKILDLYLNSEHLCILLMVNTNSDPS